VHPPGRRTEGTHSIGDIDNEQNTISSADQGSVASRRRVSFSTSSYILPNLRISGGCYGAPGGAGCDSAKKMENRIEATKIIPFWIDSTP
jgi:hypothetical protein